ncbi:MAG: 2OG-Fe(II) oxygenase [Candidatus Rokubacteria bacterium]|nr:2OG-Fe(II) oxygenase [Candidatus Rokubacteria bacterium]
MLDSLRDEVTRAIARLDVGAVRARYWAQNEFVCLERFLPRSVVDRFVEEVERVRPSIHRNYIPKHKKGGSVSYYTLAAAAPAILALYRTSAFIDLLVRVTGRRVMPCPDSDPHACALYFYTEPGDHIGFHYDTSYYRGTRYTVLLGLVERSSSRLVAQLFKDDPSRAPVELRLQTHPGTLVLFNGDTLWHAITPLGQDEERVSLTMEYVTDPTMRPLKRFVSNMKDAIAYFGFRAVFRRPSRLPGG